MERKITLGSQRTVCSICCNPGSWWKVIRAGVNLEERTCATWIEQAERCVYKPLRVWFQSVFCIYKTCLDLISAHMKPTFEFKWSFVLLEDLWRKVAGLPWICSWLGVSSSRKDQPLGYQLWTVALFGPHGDLVFSSQAHNRLSSPSPGGRKARQRGRFSFLILPPGCREGKEKELTQSVFLYSQLFTSKGACSVARPESSCRWKCIKWMELLVWVN